MEINTYYDLEEVLENELDVFSDTLLTESADDLFDPEGWQRPSTTIKKYFAGWRSRTFRKEFHFYNGVYDPNPQPAARNGDLEIERTAWEISDLWHEMDEFITDGDTNEAYLSLARINGKVDYLNWLCVTREEPILDYVRLLLNTERSKKSNDQSNSNAQSISEIPWVSRSENAKLHLFNAVKAEGLINDEANPNEFFVPNKRTTWASENTKLIYLVRGLLERGYLDPKHTYAKIIKAFFLDRQGRSFKTTSLYSSKSRDPGARNSQAINVIINNLPIVKNK